MANDCDSYIRTPVVENTTLNTWQNVQIDIDLNSDTYDLFWGTTESEMQLVAPYSRFRSDEQDFIDRFVVAYFLNPEFSYPAGNAFLDNVNIEIVKRDWIGDANMDGEFNSGDFVAVFQAGKYETGEIAAWSQGDWNGDRVFDSGDFVAAFQDGGYEMGPRSITAAVPEPSGCLFVTLATLLFPLIRRKRLQ